MLYSTGGQQGASDTKFGMKVTPSISLIWIIPKRNRHLGCFDANADQFNERY
jgi:hypothetical protein